ncbi:hypothetical protein EV181_007494, partial [Coemansia sp. RSA 532]
GAVPLAAKSARAISLTSQTPTFKARAGRLIKTTSIPLSTFGASFHGASQLLPSQGHLSDGNDDVRPVDLRPGAATELDSGELVYREENEQDGSPDTGAGAKQAKKATQKRSTRRVKLQPVGKDGTIDKPVRPSRARNTQLVSENFYKLRIKNGRRGPRSTEDRRSALYKRMVAKKQHVKGSAAVHSGRADQEQVDESVGAGSFSCSEGSDNDILTTNSQEDMHSLARAGRAGAILGMPLWQLGPCS